MDVILPAASRRALVLLQNRRAAEADAETRLATGLKAPRPADDPIAFRKASAFRAEAEALERSLDDIGSAQSAVRAGLEGLKAGRALLDALRAETQALLRAAPPEPRYETSIKLGVGLRPQVDLGTLGRDGPDGPPVNGNGLTIDMIDVNGALIRRARFHYTNNGRADDVPAARYYARTVGEMVEDVAASGLPVSIAFEGDGLRLTSSDPSVGVRLSGSRTMTDVMRARFDLIYADRSDAPREPRTRIEAVSGVTEATDLASLGPGVSENRLIRFLRDAPDNPRGYVEASFRYRTDDRGDRGGRTIGDLIGFINDRIEGMDARLEGGRLIVEGDGRALHVEGSNALLDAAGMPDGTYWGGVEAAPKRIVGAVPGLGPATDAPSNTGPIEDASGGSFRFRRGTGPGDDGTTLGDFVRAFNEAEARGEIALRAGFTDDGRLFLATTDGTNRIPAVRSSLLTRMAGLLYTRPPSAPAGSPFVLPEASLNVSAERLAAFEALDASLETYDAVIREAEAGGVSALSGRSRIAIDAEGTRYHLGGRAAGGLLSAALDLKPLEIWDMADRKALERRLERIDGALGRLETHEGRLALDATVLDVRRDFNAAVANLNVKGAETLTRAVPEETAAEALAARTGHLLALEALGLTMRSARGVLDIF